MSTSVEANPWDFTPVLELLHSFTPRERGGKHQQQQIAKPVGCLTRDSPKNDALGFLDGAADIAPCRKLGDFGDLFQFLSQVSPPHLDSTKPKDGACGVASVSTQRDDGRGYEACNGITSAATGANVPSCSSTVTATELLLTTTTNASAANTTLQTREHTKPFQPQSILRRSDTKPSVPVTPAQLKAPATRSRLQVESVLTGSAADRKQDLISRLLQHYTKEKIHLQKLSLQSSPSSRVSTVIDGIHVFIDMSNVMVGFHECIKEARGIPLNTRVPRLPLSFHNLSIVLERGRPASKRVLVGSDRIAAITEAEGLGYETNILERVHKAKEPSSPRKKYKQPYKNGQSGNKKNSGGNKPHDQSSGSETNARPAVERWVEQAVDEILHLKMLESVVDSERPSTIVLATGDAAEAEYSGGFLKMVERALSKGWSVELVSFSTTTSRAYSRKDFRAKWGAKFKLIQLDRYAEHLLDL